MKKLLALLCAAWLLTAAAAAENTFMLPEHLLVIGEEAFQMPQELGEDGIEGPDAIVIPEGTREIRARAFAYNPVTRIDLPRTLAFIEDDAFAGCGNVTLMVWRDSYAHRWCMEHDVRYAVLDEEDNREAYAVHSLDLAEDENGGTVFRCAVTTANACVLRVDVLSDEMQSVMSTVTAPVKAGQENLTVDISPEGELARYFVLRAVLEDEDGNELCAARTYSRRTSAHDAFMQKTPDDYPQEAVLDFGAAGFAVLDANVIPLGAKATVISGGGYTFAAGQALSVGEIVLLDVDGTPTPVKIASVRDNGNGTVTVVRDEDVALSEMYDVIRMNAVMVSDDAQAKSLDGNGVTTTFKETVAFHQIRVECDLKSTVRAQVNYNEETDYLEVLCEVEVGGTAGIFLGHKVDTWKKNNAPAIPLFTGGLKIPGVDAGAYFKASIPVNIQTALGGNLFVRLQNRSGYMYNSIDGFQKVEESESGIVDYDLVGKASLKFGPEISLNLTLFEALKGRIGGQAGPLLEGEIKKPAQDEPGDGTQKSFHACETCIDMDLSTDVNLRGTLTGKIGKHVSVTFVDVNLGLYKEKKKDYYASCDNEAQSVHGGEFTFGEGYCPNYKYLATILAKDPNGRDMPGTPITLTGSKTETVHGSSPLAAYLYPGSYTALAAFELGEGSTAFDVKGASVTIPVYEPAIVIEGSVRDMDTYKAIPGASVMLTLPNGSVRIEFADSRGEFYCESLPAGSYTIVASAEKYKSYTFNSPEYAAGGAYGVHFTLEKKKVTIEGSVRDSQTGEPIHGATVTAQLPDGSVRTHLTGADGRYRFIDLPGGVYTLSASANDHESQTFAQLDFEPGSDNTVDFSLIAIRIDEIIMRRLVAYMGDDLIQRMKNAGFDVGGSFSYYTDAQGEGALKFTIRFDVDYNEYAADKDLFREGELAIIDSGIFPLTEAELAEIRRTVAGRRGVDISINTASGFSAWGGMPINSVVVQYGHDARSSGSTYTNRWNSSWSWDQMTWNQVK